MQFAKLLIFCETSEFFIKKKHSTMPKSKKHARNPPFYQRITTPTHRPLHPPSSHLWQLPSLAAVYGYPSRLPSSRPWLLILPSSPYLRKHLARHPALELLRLWKLGRKDERVNTALVNDGHRLCSSKGALNQGVLFIFCIHMICYRIT